MADNRIISSPHNLLAHRIHSAYAGNVSTIKPQPEAVCAPAQADISQTQNATWLGKQHRCKLTVASVTSSSPSARCYWAWWELWRGKLGVRGKESLPLVACLTLCWPHTCASPSRSRPQTWPVPLQLTCGSSAMTELDKEHEKNAEKNSFPGESGGREAWGKSLLWPVPQASTHFAARTRVASHVHSHGTLCYAGRMSILAWVRYGTKTIFPQVAAVTTYQGGKEGMVLP